MLKRNPGVIKTERILTDATQKLSRAQSHMKILIPKEVSEHPSELYFEKMTDRILESLKSKDDGKSVENS
jgi:hypothetical protein